MDVIVLAGTVGMPPPTNAPLREIFNGKKGFCLVEVSHAHPFLHIQTYSAQQTSRNQELERVVADLQAELRSLAATVSLLQDEGTLFLNTK